ncbi:MAG: tetratricopeptide repeat protein [Candidatus Kapaibacterium sp.]
MTVPYETPVSKNGSSVELHRRVDHLVEQAELQADKAPERTIALCKEARSRLHETFYPAGTIRIEIALATALINSSRYREAATVLEELRPICTEHGTEADRARLHFCLGTACSGLGDHSQALFNTEESLGLAMKFGLRKIEAKSNMLLGTIYLNINLPDKALKHAIESLKMFQEIGDDPGLSKALNNVGSIYNDTGDHDRAIKFFQKSLAIKRQIDDQHGVANSLNNIANILFWSRKEYSRALDYYEESLEISRTHGYTDLVPKSLQHIGQVYVYLERYEEAIQRSHEGLELLRDVGSEADIAYSLMDLGFVYCNAGRMEESVEFILDGLRIAEEIDATIHMYKGYNLLRQIYWELHDYENAVRYSDLYIRMQKRFFDEASDKRIKSLTIQFEVETTRQEKELYRLRTEKLRQEVVYKSKELTTMAMYLLQKNEFLGNLSRQIKGAPPVDDDSAQQLLDSLQRQIQEALRGDRQWDIFEQQFRLVHHDFVGRLSDRFPSLTPMELKVGALLRMDLSTKEIAGLLYQSPRSIESYRYRLRRKMNIPTTTNLTTFMASL